MGRPAHTRKLIWSVGGSVLAPPGIDGHLWARVPLTIVNLCIKLIYVNANLHANLLVVANRVDN